MLILIAMRLNPSANADPQQQVAASPHLLWSGCPTLSVKSNARKDHRQQSHGGRFSSLAAGASLPLGMVSILWPCRRQVLCGMLGSHRAGHNSCHIELVPRVPSALHLRQAPWELVRGI